MGEWLEKWKGRLEKARGRITGRRTDTVRGTIHEQIGEAKKRLEDVKRDIEPRRE